MTLRALKPWLIVVFYLYIKTFVLYNFLDFNKAHGIMHALPSLMYITVHQPKMSDLYPFEITHLFFSNPWATAEMYSDTIVLISKFSYEQNNKRCSV